jgi:hypothetical protein
MKNKGPAGGLPFANTMGDSFDLMKKMWGMAGLPGMPNAGNLATMAMRLPQQLPSMVAPTLDVNELDKRIADLRAVEAWLELNSSMLRTTIQTLEVQRATIATLKGISGAMLAPLTRPGQKPEGGALPPNAFAMPPMPAPEEPGAARKSSGRRRHKAKPPHPPTVADAPLNPTAWWNTLQDQFTKIAATAAAGAATPAKKPAKAPSAKRAGKAGKSS